MIGMLGVGGFTADIHNCSRKMHHLAGLLILLIQIIGWAEGTGKIATKFLNYDNPEGKRLDGYCCDKYSWWGTGDCKTGDTCDPGFVICLGNITQSSSIEDCEYGRKTTGQLSDNANNIRFEEKVGQINNPLVFEFDEWPGIVKINILAIDADGSDRYDIVDTFGYQHNQYDLVRELDTNPKTLQLTGSRSSLDLELKVFCDTNFYGENCKVYCVPRDDEEGHFMCDPLTGQRNCLPGWAGDDCLTNKDDCNGNRCSYGATCKDGVNSYTCVCPAGLTGLLCEAEINECSSNPCRHGGKCKDARGFFYCICPVGTSGDYCEIDVIECVSDPCQNNATCVDEINAYQCVCQAGFTGAMCEEEIDECASGPCVQAEKCVDLTGDYQCVCTEGFTGKNCEINIDECKSAPCQNNGLCMDDINSYTCICRDGTSGKYCEVNFDECESNPCQNGGSCQDAINFYTCDCPISYTGTHCETKIEPCDSEPCLNGATCVNEADNFTCNCLQGFDGPTCEENINECDSDPCQNGGFCLDLTGKFECRCPSTTSGEMCEFVLETTTIPTTIPTTEPTTIPSTEEMTTEVFVSTIPTMEEMTTEFYISTIPTDEELKTELYTDETSAATVEMSTQFTSQKTDNITTSIEESDTITSMEESDNITISMVESDSVTTSKPSTDVNETLPDTTAEEYTAVSSKDISSTEGTVDLMTPDLSSEIMGTRGVDTENLTDIGVTDSGLTANVSATDEQSTGDEYIYEKPDVPPVDLVPRTPETYTETMPSTGMEVQDMEGSGLVESTETAPILTSSTLGETTTSSTVSPIQSSVAASTVPSTTTTSTISDASESSIDTGETASGDFDDSLTSLSPAETVGIDLSDSLEDVSSGDLPASVTSTRGPRLTSPQLIDEAETGLRDTDDSTPEEAEYSVVTSGVPLTTPRSELEGSGEVEEEVGSGEIMASSTVRVTGKPEDTTVSVSSTTSDYFRLTLPTFTTETPNVTVTREPFQRPTDIFNIDIDENIFEPTFVGTTRPLITLPDRKRFTTVKYVPKMTPKPYKPITTIDTPLTTPANIEIITPYTTPKSFETIAPYTTPKTFETTTLGEDLESVATWIYDRLSTISSLITPESTTEKPRTTTEEGAGPPPPLNFTKDQTPGPRTTRRGDLPPEEDKTTVRTKPTKPPQTTTQAPKTLSPSTKSVTFLTPIIITTAKPKPVKPMLGSPSIRTTVYHTVKNAYNVGKKIADAAYKKAKVLLHRTIRRLNDLWRLCVKHALKVAYAPYNYARGIYTTAVNRGSRYVTNSVRYARSRLRKFYGSARKAMSNYYSYLRDYYKKRYNYYYTQYYNYYRNLKNKWWNFFG